MESGVIINGGTIAAEPAHATFRLRANMAVESPVVTALDQVKAVLEEGELVQSKTTPKPLLESKLSADVGDHVNPDSVQQLQDQVEEYMQLLHNRFEQQHEKFRQRWFDMSFDDTVIEEQFAEKTFTQQKKYMIRILGILVLYLVLAFFFYSVRKMASVTAPTNSSCHERGERFWAAEVGPADYYSLDAQKSRLAWALLCRGGCIVAALCVIGFLQYAPRKLTLCAMVVFS